MRGIRLKVANHLADKFLYTENCWWGDKSERAHGIARKTKCVCSCWMCGHRRKHNGPNMQEIRQLRAKRTRRITNMKHFY